MAKREEQQSNFKYLGVKHHSIVEESKEPRENFEEVEVTNPTTGEKIKKYIDKWGALTGHIIGVEAYDRERDKVRYRGFKLNIDNEVILDLPQKTPAYDAFCKAAENIDFTKEVTLSAYHNRAKDRTGFSIKQGGEPVEWKYTKDNMGDCPQWEKNEDDEWDSSKQRAFLRQRITDVVIPAVEAARAERLGTDFEPTATETSEAEAPEYSGSEATEMEAPKADAATAGSSAKKTGKTKKTEPVSDDDIPF